MTEDNCHKIPFGGPRLLLWFACQYIVFFYILPFHYKYVSQASGLSAVGFFLFGLSTVVIAYLAIGRGLLLPSDDRVKPWEEPFRFIYHWFRRNVIGYYKATYNTSFVSGDARSMKTKVQTLIWYRMDNRPAFANVPSQYAVVEALGGWFSKSYISGHGRILAFAHPGWTLLVDRKFYLGNRDGSRFACRDEEEVLRVLQALSEAPTDYPGTFARLIADRFRDVSSVDAMRQQSDCYQEERNKLFQIMLESVSRLGNTKRFIKSKEAMAIRKWLVGELKPFQTSDHFTNF